MILTIVSAFRAPTGYNVHLEKRCFLNKRAAPPPDPRHGTGMLTRSAICSPLLPSGFVMLPYSENTRGERHQCHGETNLLTCTHAHIHTHMLFCSFVAECISLCRSARDARSQGSREQQFAPERTDVIDVRARAESFYDA